MWLFIDIFFLFFFIHFKFKLQSNLVNCKLKKPKIIINFTFQTTPRAIWLTLPTPPKYHVWSPELFSDVPSSVVSPLFRSAFRNICCRCIICRLSSEDSSGIYNAFGVFQHFLSISIDRLLRTWS